MVGLELDHLAVCAASLAEGVEYVEDLLGVVMSAGGRHELMGTHNRLLSLGPLLYLEVITIDPDAPPPGRVRWFDLDRFSGAPRLCSWVVRCEDMADALALAPAGMGRPVALVRGDLRWQMAVSGDGKLPFGGAYPGLICWQGAHPAAELQDQGCRLEMLEVLHPDAEGLRGYLGADMQQVQISQGTEIRLQAHIQTEAGVKLLC